MTKPAAAAISFFLGLSAVGAAIFGNGELAAFFAGLSAGIALTVQLVYLK